LTSFQDAASIYLGFIASSVNIVTGEISQPIKLEVLINGGYISKEQAGNDVIFENGKSFILINEPKLYNVVNGKHGTYILQLRAESQGFSFNAFTFG